MPFWAISSLLGRESSLCPVYLCCIHPYPPLKVKVKSLSRVRLFATPWTVACQAPLSMGFSRQEYWSGLPFPSSGALLNPGIEPGSPAWWADALPSEPPLAWYRWPLNKLKLCRSLIRGCSPRNTCYTIQGWLNPKTEPGIQRASCKVILGLADFQLQTGSGGVEIDAWVVQGPSQNMERFKLTLCYMSIASWLKNF